ncbi:MAG TPA: DUF4386 family protein [Acidobacteriaceae bacterium]|nr:DUF4386 family protein [Acidobacteriaceae bacterium]
MTDRRGDTSPQVLARAAGVLYFLSVFTAVVAEFFFRGQLGFFLAVVVPISCYMAVTLLLYLLFRAVNRMLVWAAVVFGVAGLVCEALQWKAHGINIGMGAHGVYCVLIGLLMLRSRFLPRWAGVLMAVGGLVWLMDLAPAVNHRLASFSTVIGLLGEGIPMLWLMVKGVSEEQWKEQAAAPATT